MNQIGLKWLGLLLAGLLIGGWSTGRAAAPETRMAIAVVEFSVLGDLHEQAGAVMADLMTQSIANTGRFTLKDRLPLSAVAKIAKAQDQELGYTGLLDPKTAAEIGRRYGLDAVVIGAINKPGDLITVTARLIDTKTASLLRSGQIQGRDIDTIQIKVNELATMISEAPKPPPTYGLVVRTQPADASIRLLNSATPYQPGVRLPPGVYELEIGRAGYAARRESVTIADRDVALNVTLEPARYGLTVQAEPADAQIRLLNTSTAYKTGVDLPPGSYEIEVVKEGYVSRKIPVQIVDSALTIPVTLEKQPAPTQYRLTVQTDPSGATVRLPEIKPAYQPGMELLPGDYTVEVSQSGYESQRMTVKIVDSDVTVPVKLVKIPEPVKPAPVTWRLTVRTDPASARVRLIGVRTKYQPGVALTPGSYTVEVSRSGYESQRVTVRIADSDVTMPVNLVKTPEPVKPATWRLTVRTEPRNARVRLVNSSFTYRPGVALPPGNYTVEVSARGYQPRQTAVQITDRDLTESVTLERIATVAPTVAPAAPPPPSRAGEWRIGSVQVDSSISGVDRSEVQRVLSRYVGQTATRSSLLDSALQVYRSTGITLRFTVRNSASGSAELQARVSQRLRRTYESSVPLVTRSQLENSGFGVSVD